MNENDRLMEWTNEYWQWRWNYVLDAIIFTFTPFFFLRPMLAFLILLITKLNYMYWTLLVYVHQRWCMSGCHHVIDDFTENLFLHIHIIIILFRNWISKYVIKRFVMWWWFMNNITVYSSKYYNYILKLCKETFGMMQ